MQREEIENIISKYRKLANASCDDEKIFQYERFADFVEEEIEYFEDDEYYETEKDLIEYFNEVESEVDTQWNNMFPEGNDDDSVTDYMTR